MMTKRKLKPRQILKGWLLPFKPMPDASTFVAAFRDEMKDRLQQFNGLDEQDQELAIDQLLKGIWLLMEDTRKRGYYSLSPVETLYGFCAWLTTRKKATIMSTQHDSSVVVPLITRFVKAQGWETKCRDYWHHNVKRVPETIADLPAKTEF